MHNLLERKMHMPIEQRIRMCLLIEMMQEQKVFSEKLGLENISKFHGKRINEEEERITC